MDYQLLPTSFLVQGAKRMGQCTNMQTARLCSVTIVALALVLSVGPARAAIYTLTDQNTSISIDGGSQAGISNWTVDGVDVLHQQSCQIGSTSAYCFAAEPSASSASSTVGARDARSAANATAAPPSPRVQDSVPLPMSDIL